MTVVGAGAFKALRTAVFGSATLGFGSAGYAAGGRNTAGPTNTGGAAVFGACALTVFSAGNIAGWDRATDIAGSSVRREANCTAVAGSGALVVSDTSYITSSRRAANFTGPIVGRKTNCTAVAGSGALIISLASYITGRRNTTGTGDTFNTAFFISCTLLACGAGGITGRRRGWLTNISSCSSSRKTGGTAVAGILTISRCGTGRSTDRELLA